ncbi:MAG: response regulator transcription factor [Clostridiales bacterium]|jgi:DNA-binding response OmpR family regulator|nr:response regulator transcription factor [Clostridiales bacterium]MBQ1573175.1 response regulator transcription factor [Clostridiales bacterium]
MILIIEDDSTINSLLCGILKKSGYEVESCTDGLTGYNMALDKDYQLILMDLMLPMKSGEEILRALREVKKTPVIVLSAKNDVHNRIELLRLGADDFICKPFDIDEVILRIEAVLRRVEDVKDVLTYKQMRIDKEARRIFIGDDELICTATEYAILELMLGNPGKVFSKRNLFESVTGDNYLSEENTMNVHMSNLRKKIAKITDEPYIDTVYGMGYRMAN